MVVGVGIGLLALLVLVFYVIAPPAPRVARDRRSGTRRGARVDADEGHRTHDRGDRVGDVEATSRMFGPQELEMAGIKTDPSRFVVLVASAASVLALIGVLVGFANGTWCSGRCCSPCSPPSARRSSSRCARASAVHNSPIKSTTPCSSSPGDCVPGTASIASLAAVASDAESPTSEEFARVVNEIRLGRNLSDSLAITARRMHSDDFEWVAQAIAINQETGGNLAEVLDQVGEPSRTQSDPPAGECAERRRTAVGSHPRRPADRRLPLSRHHAAEILRRILRVSSASSHSSSRALLLIIGTIWISFTVKVKF